MKPVNYKENSFGEHSILRDEMTLRSASVKLSAKLSTNIGVR